MSKTVQPDIMKGILAQGTTGTAHASPINIADLQRMERQLIPLLNTVRQMQGKRPVIVPGEKRTHGG